MLNMQGLFLDHGSVKISTTPTNTLRLCATNKGARQAPSEVPQTNQRSKKCIALNGDQFLDTLRLHL